MLRLLLMTLVMPFLSRAPTFSSCTGNSMAVPLNVRHKGLCQRKGSSSAHAVPPCYCVRQGMDAGPQHSRKEAGSTG